MIKMYNFCDGLKLVVSRKHMNCILIVINGGFWSLTFPSSWGLVSNSCSWPNCTNTGVSICTCIRTVWILALKIISCNRYTHQDLFMHILFIISRKVSLHFYQVCMQGSQSRASSYSQHTLLSLAMTQILGYIYQNRRHANVNKSVYL